MSDGEGRGGGGGKGKIKRDPVVSSCLRVSRFAWALRACRIRGWKSAQHTHICCETAQVLRDTEAGDEAHKVLRIVLPAKPPYGKGRCKRGERVRKRGGWVGGGRPRLSPPSTHTHTQHTHPTHNHPHPSPPTPPLPLRRTAVRCVEVH